MLKFFSMVVEGFVAFFLWLNKFTLFSNTASALSNLRLLSRKTLLFILIPFIVIYIALLMAFFYYMIDSIIIVYNLISSFLLKMQDMNSINTGSSSILQPFYLLLNSVGFVNGFQASFPFIASALLFRLLSALYRLVLKTNLIMIRFGTSLIQLVTAA